MFTDIFSLKKRQSIDNLAHNFTDIPSHLLICIFHEVARKEGFKQYWENNDRNLVDSLDMSRDACVWSHLWERMLKIIAMVIGVPGNLMAAYVSMSIDRVTTSVFLTALSLGDFLTIALRTMAPETTITEFELCKRTIGFFPNSILVLICFERYMAVCHPWKKKRLLTMNIAYVTVLVFAVIYVLVLLTCIVIARTMEEQDYVVSFVVAFFLFGFPCPFIVIFNWLTIRKLKQMTVLQGQTSVHFSYWSKAEASITFMIIIASVVFLALNGPLFFVCLGWFLLEILGWEQPADFHSKADFVISLAYWLTFLHHGVNFYLYVLGTKRFRMQFIILLKKWKSLNWLGNRFLTPSPSQAFKTKSSISGPKGTLSIGRPSSLVMPVELQHLTKFQQNYKGDKPLQSVIPVRKLSDKGTRHSSEQGSTLV